MSEAMEERTEEEISLLNLVERGVGGLAVQEALEQRRQAILEKLQRDNADAGM